MKATVYDIKGKEKTKIDLPKIFESKIREDVVNKTIEAKKKKQPYGPNPRAGLGYSARGKIRHRRHVWQTHYGRGMSRIPRKVMSQRGTQFNWEGASVPFSKGGKRAHPPKPISAINTKKVNKKELIIALKSAISASATKEYLVKRYSSIEKKDLRDLPIVVESKMIGLKAKQIEEGLKKILGEELFRIAKKNKTQRSGKGKTRGRKYKSSLGCLFVLSKKEKMKSKIYESTSVDNLGVEDLAKGGMGRLVIYTESAIKEMGDKK
jgi:large subunit ribosomal protein L4e